MILHHLWEVVGSVLNEPEFCGLNEPQAKLDRFYYKPSVTVLMLVKEMSVILQKGLKEVLLKHYDFIVSSLGVAGNGVKWTSLLALLKHWQELLDFNTNYSWDERFIVSIIS